MSWLTQCFDIKDQKYTGVDGGICKAVLIAKQAGTIGDVDDTPLSK